MVVAHGVHVDVFSRLVGAGGGADGAQLLTQVVCRLHRLALQRLFPLQLGAGFVVLDRQTVGGGDGAISPFA